MRLDAHLVEPVAGAIAAAVVAASERVSAWATQARRWARGGLDDAWPDDMHRLRYITWLWSGMPALAARVAAARTAVWVRVHRVFLAALLTCALSAALGGMLAFNTVVRGAWRLSLPAAQAVLPAQPYQVGPGIVLQPQGTPTPTVGLPTYMVGAWPSASAPSEGATVMIFVRLTASASLRPVSGAVVTLQVEVTCANPFRSAGIGPVATGADGIAAIPVRVSGMPGGQPVCVTATVRVDGQVLTASTTFSPL